MGIERFAEGERNDPDGSLRAKYAASTGEPPGAGPDAGEGGKAASIAAEPPPSRMCKCGRGPWRPGQRNCVQCNREANGKYRLSLEAFPKL